MKVLCVFGKHQYGDPSRGLGTEYAAFVPALRNLGHDVVHFESWNRACYPDYGQLNQALLSTVERERPDVMLTVQLNYEIWIETLLAIKDEDRMATICWTTDDSWKYREVSRFIGGFYHAMATTYGEALPLYQRDGIRNVLLTQWAANSAYLRAPFPARECRHEVTFVGEAHGNRKQRIADLRNYGIMVSCFGYGWPGGPVPAQRIPQIMRESVISLNFANSKGRNQIKARTFEVPGAGGFLLTEYAPGMEKCYVLGKEIEIFEGTEALEQKIRHFLMHPEERDRNATAGFERTARDHTYEMRMKAALDFALRARAGAGPTARKTPGPTFEKALQAHRLTRMLKLFRMLLVGPSIAIWGKERGPRAARRLMFELSWRLLGKRTFTAAGWPGRLFPEQ